MIVGGRGLYVRSFVLRATSVLSRRGILVTLAYIAVCPQPFCWPLPITQPRTNDYEPRHHRRPRGRVAVRRNCRA